MNKYAIDRYLERLKTEGERLRQNGSPDDIKVWFATAIAALTLFLLDNSVLVKALVETKDAYAAEATPPSPTIVQSCVPNSRALAEALRLLDVAVEFNRERRDDQTMATLRDDVRTVMGETLVKSPFFYIPTALLIAAFGLAVLGVVQIRDYKIDIQKELQVARDRIDEHRKSVEATIDSLGKRAQASAEAARQAVEKKLDDQLASYLTGAKNRIDDGAKEHLESLKRTKTPALESGLITLQEKSTDLEKRVQQLQRDASSLKTRADELTDGLKRLDSAAQTGAIERLSVFLNHSRAFVLGEVIITGVALLLSGIMLTVVFLRWLKS